MNKIVASLGMAAIGASSIQAVLAEDMGAPQSKPWSISASLRGFYDSNINGTETDEVESLGFEVSPGATLDWKTDQTQIAMNYVYSFRYFEKERFVDAGHNSQSHLFRGTLDHAFNERYTVSVADWFVIGQEPDLLRNPLFGSTDTPVPISGNNIHNYGTVAFNGMITPTFGWEVGYDNSFFDYEDEGVNSVADVILLGPSLSGLLDRVEQAAHVNVNWRVARETTLFAGYQFGWINYTADERISAIGPFFFSEDKNNHSHYVYAGVTRRFSPVLVGSVTAGGRFIDYPEVDESDASPYVRGLMKWTYCPESTVEAGASYDLTMSGVATARNSETALLYVTVRHRIVPKFFANLAGQIQNSTIQGGGADGDNSLYYTLGLNLEYQFTRHFSADIGYDFDKVDSDVGFNYDRNRVYIGVTASY